MAKNKDEPTGAKAAMWVLIVAVGFMYVMKPQGDAPAAPVDVNAVAAHTVVAMTLYDPRPDDAKPPAKCLCNGTKKSGDGLGPCICGDGCDCKKSEDDTGKAAAAQNTYLEMHTASWCGPCQVFKRDVLPWLMKAGWTLGGTFRMVENTPATTAEKSIEALPTFIWYVDGKERGRHIGGATKADITELVAAPVRAAAKPNFDAQFLAGAAPSKNAMGKLFELLGSGRLEITEGVTIKSGGEINASVTGDNSGVTVVFGKPYPTTVVEKFFLTFHKTIVKAVLKKPGETAEIYMEGDRDPYTVRLR